MPVNGPFLLLLTVAAIALLLVLVLAVRVHAFLALLISSMALGLAAGQKPAAVLKSIQIGFGDALGFIAIVVGLGAMIGAFLEHSGGGRRLADWLLEKTGKERAAWAVLIAAFLVGLPLFFEVGFIILVPLVWSLTRESKRSLLYYGLPMAAALTVTHSLVPPHPAPAAAAQLLGADLGKTILYGIVIALLTALASGMGYGIWIAKRIFVPVPDMAPAPAPSTNSHPPHIALILLILLLPVGLIFAATVAGSAKLPGAASLIFLGHPFTALLLTTIAGMVLFGARRGMSAKQIGELAAASLAPVGGLLVIMGAGGAFKQVIVDTGVGPFAGSLLVSSGVSPLLVAFAIAAVMRVAQGSATVAIITAAGIVAPLVKGIAGYTPEMVVLALCCGGSGFSHVNDAGFWLVAQYFGMTVPQTLETWTVMKVISSFAGLAIVFVLQALGC